MEFVQLRKEENGLTRPLYEEVFSEDKGPFSDYYYKEVAPHSTIYIAREGDKIQSMIHLNPYRVSFNGEVLEIPYIVAVATRESYRHRGLMRSLLGIIFRDLEAAHVPFAFLMPVNEAIYLPFGFKRSWSWQWEEDVMGGLTAGPEGKITTGLQGKTGSGDEKIRPAENCPGEIRQAENCPGEMLPAEDCSDEMLQMLADRVNRTLKDHYELFTVRDAAYYRRLAREQKASGGQLQILMKGGQPLAAVQTAREDYPPMMCRIMDREAYEKRLRGPQDHPFEHAFICEVV